MQSLIIPIIMLTVTLIGGGFLLLFLKADSRKKSTGNDVAVQTAQDFINVKDIKDKVLYTKDQYVFTYLRVHSISTELYSNTEKNILVRTLTAELSDIQYPFKFLAVSRPVDISPVISDMTEMLETAGDKQKELLRQEILEMSSYALSGEVVERQFYIALWDSCEEGCETDLQKRAALLCEKFSASGILCEILGEQEIVRLLNLVHNPGYVHIEDTEYAATIPFLKEANL